MAERVYSMSARQRDQMITELYEKGYSLRAIARKVGMSASGVCRALERVQRGGTGVDRRAD